LDSVIDWPQSSMKNKIETRLALYNIAVFASVLIAFSSILYFVVRDGFYADLRSHLQQMADGVVSSIDYEHVDKETPLPDLIVSELPASVSQSLMDLRLQWFDKNGKLSIEKGTLALDMPLNRSGGYEYQDSPRAMVFTKSVVVENKLLGYARVAQPLANLDRSMDHIKLGLFLGVFFASAISGVGITLLIAKSMQPLHANIARLKQFTADASHELRTPIAAINANSSVALKYSDGMRDSDREKFEMISSATNQMGRLVNDLLQLEQVEFLSGNHAPSREVAVILNEVRKVLAWLEQDKGIEVMLEAESDLYVEADEEDLCNVVQNLLENALRYTPPGGRINMSAVRDRANITIKVADTGIGISANDLSKVFDRFWRADKARSRVAGGYGLGLSIVQSIVTRLNGTINVESEIDIGSTFIVQLPSAKR